MCFLLLTRFEGHVLGEDYSIGVKPPPVRLATKMVGNQYGLGRQQVTVQSLDLCQPYGSAG